MFDLIGAIEITMVVIQYLIYLAILIFFLNCKNDSERMRIILIVAGVFFLLFLSQGVFDFSPSSAWSFTLTQMLIMLFLAFAGIDILLDKKIVAALFIVYSVGFFQNSFLSFLIGAAAYIIVSFSFFTATMVIVEKHAVATSK